MSRTFNAAGHIPTPRSPARLHFVTRNSSLAPITQESLADQAYSALRLALLRREFEPGQQLDPQALSEQLAVSQTPLKEAIRRLADEGLVDVRPRSGSYVMPITQDRLDEALEARLLVERWAVGSAIEHATSRNWDLLDALILESEEMLADSEDAIHAEDQFTILDQAFHSELVAAAGNASLHRFYTSIGMHVMLARAWCLEPKTELESRMREGTKEHKRIVKSLRAGNTETALLELERHVMRSHARATKVIDQNGGAI